MDPSLKRAIILDNYQNPNNMEIPSKVDDYIKINSNSINCIDNIDIYVKLNNDIIEDIKYFGEACVIAVSSTSILSNLLIGKNIREAEEIINNYFNMIEEKEYDKDLLKEAEVYNDIAKQPARKTCATLFARGMKKIFNTKIEEK